MKAIEKINEEIVKMKTKVADYQARLKDLERQKTEMENAEIVALVRGVDVAPEELKSFIETYRQQRAGVPPTLTRQEEAINEE